MTDFLLVTPTVEAAWKNRIRVALSQGSVFAVSREGLILLKSLRRSGQDLDDIERLKDSQDES